MKLIKLAPVAAAALLALTASASAAPTGATKPTVSSDLITCKESATVTPDRVTDGGARNMCPAVAILLHLTAGADTARAPVTGAHADASWWGPSGSAHKPI